MLKLSRFCKLFFCLFLSITQVIFAHVSYDPELIVTIMVKNEAHIIVPTLQPYIDAGISAYVVFDTGSTDDTIAITQEFFDANPHITGYIFQEPFIDFAASRNRALDLTRETFPNGGYIIMPDAEWYLHGGQELLEFCTHVLNSENLADSYLVRMILGDIDFYQPRLIKVQSSVHFEGEIHESIYTEHTAPKDIYFLVQSTPQGFEKSKKRWERDLQILKKKYKKNPWDPRTLFYLAQTYDCLQDQQNALKYYILRSQIQGSREENFMAHYRAAQVAESLGDWDTALPHYLQAFSICPQRAEPLVKLSQHYWSVGNIPAAYLFIQYAAKMDYPINDRLFVDKTMYDFTRYEMLGITAWHMGKFEEGKIAAQKACEQRPDLAYLQHNLACYQ